MNHLIKTQQISVIGKAINSKRVNNCTEQELKDSLKYIFKLIGLIKLPDELEKKVIIDFMINDLKKFRIDEFVLAFKMAVKGELYQTVNGKDVPLSTDHYHNFSVKYLCSVMNAYENSERRHQHLQIEKFKELPQHAQKSDHEKQEAINDEILSSFEAYKKTKVMPFVCAWMYKELVKTGELNQSKELRKKIYSQAKNQLKVNLSNDKFTSNQFEVKAIENRLKTIDSDDQLNTIAREIALKHHWDEQIKES